MVNDTLLGFIMIGLIFTLSSALLNAVLGFDSENVNKVLRWKRYYIPAISGLVPILVIYITHLNSLLFFVSLAIFGTYSFVMFIKEVKRIIKN